MLSDRSNCASHKSPTCASLGLGAAVANPSSPRLSPLASVVRFSATTFSLTHAEKVRRGFSESHGPLRFSRARNAN